MEIIINDKPCGFVFNLHAIEQLDKVEGQDQSVFAFLASIVCRRISADGDLKIRFEADFEKELSLKYLLSKSDPMAQ
jgi:hypothetical protein